MPELLLELFSEEIPARMQARAEADLGAALEAKLAEAGLEHGAVSTWSGPRRLGVRIEDVAAKSEDVREERKGPKVGAPEKAVAGFLRGAGLENIEQAEVKSDPKKGEFYVAVIETPGRKAEEIIAEAVPAIVRGFHWPKSMRTGTGELRWVRPLQRILCVLGGKVVAFDVDGIASGNETEGHRVHGRGPYTVTGWDDYQSQLEGEGHVLLTRDARRSLIETQALALCQKSGLTLIEDKGLLEEVTGLAEWPMVILGEMDPAFLALPPEVIQLSMRTHQKYFAVEGAKTGQLAPNFIVVANIEPSDGGVAIAAGNAKVLSARLDDARFFWENDKETGLEAMAPKLTTIAFKEELGSIGDKVERVAALARELAPKVGADPDLAEKAARLCKADLVSEMVYEFPELQGVMGRYYALEAGSAALTPNPSPANGRGEQTEPDAPPSPGRGRGAGGEGLLSGLSKTDITQIADAIAEHYKPQGPSDAVPTAPVSVAVALADKLDTLVGFWAIGEKPTGSKDPFALRRAALGVVRIVLENEVRVGLRNIILSARVALKSKVAVQTLPNTQPDTVRQSVDQAYDAWIDPSIVDFFADRLKQVLRDEGKRHDLIDAVFSLGEDDLVLIVKRVEALSTFLASEDGANLLAAYKRAANILKAEEKKDGKVYDGVPTPSKMTESAERDLLSAIEVETVEVDAALAREDFEAAMGHLAKLRQPADEFFNQVMVNAEKSDVRANRLNLLAALRAAMHKVADFSKVEG
ncbi:MAG: glycine--tRNA ligase subunit beta [Hyphomonadaceae bacterium]|nr:glycine--tRNA ligase subunit beta [Hyphomonadaceae bacterium]